VFYTGGVDPDVAPSPDIDPDPDAAPRPNVYVALVADGLQWQLQTPPNFLLKPVTEKRA
jgi:hypothetical protein